MSARKHVFRLVVDTWPTEDGKPFADQGFRYWENIVERWADGNHADPCPDWVPDLTEWLVDQGDASHRSTPRPGYQIVINDPPDYATGYPGYPEYLMNVPAAPTRRFFTRSTVARLRDVLIEWGCTAHIERAEVGAWERIS